jgi:hypothetical protein
VTEHDHDKAFSIEEALWESTGFFTSAYQPPLSEWGLRGGIDEKSEPVSIGRIR